MNDFNVLVVGGGPTGSVAAYWLAKGGASVTVLERAPGNLAYGQGIDVESTAREIVQRMGVLQDMQSKSTCEQAFTMVDDNGKPLASIGQQGLSITSDIEIMRGDLCHILATAANQLEKVVFKYACTATAITQDANMVSVTFDDGTEANFHAVIAADGLRSKTRGLFFGSEIQANAYKPWDNFCAFFDLPYEEGDFPNSRYQQCGQARSCFIRPVSKQKSSAYLAVRLRSQDLRPVLSQGKAAQKEALRKVFEGVGGIVPRVIAQMMDAENFYFEQLGQVKLQKWSHGRCVVVGDAGYAPSPLTGQGTQLGICGAYVLAGELTAHPGDPQAAFAAYETKFRPIVEKAQTLPLGGLAPQLANPQTNWVVWANRTIFRIFAMTGLWRRLRSREEGPKLPTYPKLEAVIVGR